MIYYAGISLFMALMFHWTVVRHPHPMKKFSDFHYFVFSFCMWPGILIAMMFRRKK